MKTKNKGFTLLETMIATSHWIMLLGTFTATLIFGLKNLTNNFDAIDEMTKAILIKQKLKTLLKEKKIKKITTYQNTPNTIQIQTDKEKYTLYLYSSDDSKLDKNYTSTNYILKIEKTNLRSPITYGSGQTLLKNILPPPKTKLTPQKNAIYLELYTTENESPYIIKTIHQKTP